jgi:hypothetical protein
MSYSDNYEISGYTLSECRDAFLYLLEKRGDHIQQYFSDHPTKQAIGDIMRKYEEMFQPKKVKLRRQFFNQVTMDSDDTDHFYSVNFKLHGKEIRVNNHEISIKSDFEKPYKINKQALREIMKAFDIINQHIDEVEQ